MRGTIEFNWWRVSDTETNTSAVLGRHEDALKETAVDTIQKQVEKGCVEGELHDNIHMVDDDTQNGVEYRGYWRLIKEQSQTIEDLIRSA